MPRRPTKAHPGIGFSDWKPGRVSKEYKENFDQIRWDKDGEEVQELADEPSTIRGGNGKS